MDWAIESAMIAHRQVKLLVRVCSLIQSQVRVLNTSAEMHDDDQCRNGANTIEFHVFCKANKSP
jgi:hypothetical protein